MTLDDLRPTAPDRAVLQDLYQRYEFRSWLRELAPAEVTVDAAAPAAATAASVYELVLDQAAPGSLVGAPASC